MNKKLIGAIAGTAGIALLAGGIWWKTRQPVAPQPTPAPTITVAPSPSPVETLESPAPAPAKIRTLTASVAPSYVTYPAVLTIPENGGGFWHIPQNVHPTEYHARTAALAP